VIPVVLRRWNILLLRTDSLRPHEGKLQSDWLEFEDFEIEVLTRGGFLWLRDIGGVFDQNTDAMLASSQRYDNENNELCDFCIP